MWMKWTIQINLKKNTLQCLLHFRQFLRSGRPARIIYNHPKMVALANSHSTARKEVAIRVKTRYCLNASDAGVLTRARLPSWSTSTSWTESGLPRRYQPSRAASTSSTPRSTSGAMTVVKRMHILRTISRLWATRIMMKLTLKLIRLKIEKFKLRKA